MGRSHHKKVEPSKLDVLKERAKRYLSLEFLRELVFTSQYAGPAAFIFIFCDFLVSVLVVQKVNYTEIDWRAYMQEVEGFLNGTWDYSELKGDTGPLVYPAGFVYIYSALYYITDQGRNIRLAQYIFVFLYVLNLALVLRIYIKTKKVPVYVFAIMCFSTYRIHSVFMLRLFNDPLAMVLLFASLNLFLEEKWSWGSLLFSLAVSVKMNILLFAPALLIAYLTSLNLRQVSIQMCICGVTQLVLALPFLCVNPISYVIGSFNLGRVFEHKWTVNWRFLPEDTFVNPYFHGALLAAHIFTLCLFCNVFLVYLKSYARLKCIEKDLKSSKKKTPVNMSSMAQLFIFPMFVANFIGIVFSRSLHYQFYVWYYYTLPYLLWSTTLSVTTRLTLLGIIEFCWNTYPSTDFSSALLHISHFIILVNIYKTSRERTTS